MIVILGLFIIVGTYLWRNGIGNAWTIIGGFQVAVFLIPILGGFFYKKKTPMGGTIGIIAGIIYFIACKATYGSYEKSQIEKAKGGK